MAMIRVRRGPFGVCKDYCTRNGEVLRTVYTFVFKHPVKTGRSIPLQPMGLLLLVMAVALAAGWGYACGMGNGLLAVG
jgi:hypothetical protein